MLKRQGWLCVLAIIFLGTSAAAPMPFFTPYQATYRITWHGMSIGESHHQLQAEGEHYHFRAKTAPNLPFVPYSYDESADFHYHNGRIYPDHYQYQKQEGSKKKSGELAFDWKAKHIRIVSAPDRTPLPLHLGILDEVSQNFALRHDLRKGKKGDITYQVVHKDEIRRSHFTWLGEEPLETALGTLDTIKLAHTSKKGDKRTLFWLSKSHDYLLVYTEQYHKDQLSARAEILTLAH